MTHDQLTGKYARLRAELDAAYGEPEWSACRTGRIDRIAGELVEIERLLASGAYRRTSIADTATVPSLPSLPSIPSLADLNATSNAHSQLRPHHPQANPRNFRAA